MPLNAGMQIKAFGTGKPGMGFKIKDLRRILSLTNIQNPNMKTKNNQSRSKSPSNSLVFDSKEVDKLLKKAEKRLLGEEATYYHINPKAKDRKEFRNRNSELFNAIKNRAIVYCIWEETKKQKTIAYIGHCCASCSSERIINHFFKKDRRTGSVLDKVKDSQKNGKNIGYSFIATEPSYMRYVLEDMLIKKYATRLIWNKNNKKTN